MTRHGSETICFITLHNKGASQSVGWLVEDEEEVEVGAATGVTFVTGLIGCERTECVRALGLLLQVLVSRISVLAWFHGVTV